MNNNYGFRLNKIFCELPSCEKFADVGCDHGYIAKMMLDEKKCKIAVITDVSMPSLQKAEKLLTKTHKGEFISCLADGFIGVPKVDVALIAGMGGETIISILSSADYLPEKLVLQPMKNTSKVRVFLVDNGYAIKKDYMFFDGDKFYDLIVCERGQDSLSEDEIEFGRDNLALMSKDFLRWLKDKIEVYETALKKCDTEAKSELNEKLERYKKVLYSTENE